MRQWQTETFWNRQDNRKCDDITVGRPVPPSRPKPDCLAVCGQSVHSPVPQEMPAPCYERVASPRSNGTVRKGQTRMRSLMIEEDVTAQQSPMQKNEKPKPVVSSSKSPVRKTGNRKVTGSVKPPSPTTLMADAHDSNRTLLKSVPQQTLLTLPYYADHDFSLSVFIPLACLINSCFEIVVR